MIRHARNVLIAAALLSVPASAFAEATQTRVASGLSAAGERVSTSKPLRLAKTSDRCTLTMGWDPWEPYQFEDENGNVSGLDVELVVAIANRAGCDVEFQKDNWAKLLRQLQDGKIDLLTGATRTPARDRFAWFSAPYRSESFILYVRSEDRDKLSATSLPVLLAKGFRVGITKEYVYGSVISALQQDPRYSDQFVGASLGEMNYARLVDGQIDGLLEDPFVATAVLKRRNWQKDITDYPVEIHSGEVHIMFSRKSVDEATVSRMDESLAELREKGKYKKIIARYRQ